MTDVACESPEAQARSLLLRRALGLIMKHEVVEVSVGFVLLGGLLCAAALLLGRAWRPLP